jgi:metallo-beta-lactamase class B
MKNKNFTLLSTILSLSLTACSQAPLTPDSLLENARQLAGEDKYLQVTQKLQCNDYGPKESPVGVGRDAKNIIVEPTQVFDNLYYIGGNRTGSWLFTTAEGYFMIDAMYGDSPEKVLIPGMKKLGLDPAQLKYILITHAGPDHAGGTKYFQEHFGTRIIMSQQDWDGLLKPKAGSWVLNKAPKEQRPTQEREWLGPPAMDLVGADGQTLTLGDTTLTMIFAPRRANGGGLSFIVPVKDNDETHMWGTYGNAGAPRSASDRALHRQSIKHFISSMEKTKVDTITSSHPFVDGSIERMEELKDRSPGAPNPFVIGEQAAKNYLDIMDQCTALKMARNDMGLDDRGLPKE